MLEVHWATKGQIIFILKNQSKNWLKLVGDFKSCSSNTWCITYFHFQRKIYLFSHCKSKNSNYLDDAVIQYICSLIMICAYIPYKKTYFRYQKKAYWIQHKHLTHIWYCLLYESTVHVWSNQHKPRFLLTTTTTTVIFFYFISSSRNHLKN